MSKKEAETKLNKQLTNNEYMQFMTNKTTASQ